MQHALRTWRDLLALIILDPLEKQRMARELGVAPITLERWAANEHSPSLEKLNRLWQSIPVDQQQQFGEFIRAEYAGFSSPEPVALQTEVACSFWPLLFRTRREAPLRFKPVCRLTLTSALVQLDARRQGTEIVVVCCMPPKDGKVRSVRERVRMGTRPWRGDVEPCRLFYGIESLAGYAVATMRVVVVQDVQQDTDLVAAHQLRHGRAAGAFPIVCEEKVAGCLLICSSQANFFTPQCVGLLNQYADALTLAFCDDEFFDATREIELQVVPSYAVQAQAFANFDERVEQRVRQVRQDDNPLSTLQGQAQEFVQLQLEAELLGWPPARKDTVTSER
jgi:hypothetical protein